MNRGKIIFKILEKYSKDPNVEGIMLFGSAVRGNMDKYSDVDVFVLTKKVGKYRRQSFKQDGYVMDIIIDSIDEANKYLKFEKFNTWKNVSHMIGNGQIVFDKNGNMDKTQKIAQRNLSNRTKFSEDEILMHKYSIFDFYGEVRRFSKSKNHFALSKNAELLINNAIELFLKVRGIYLLRPNELIQSIKVADKNFGLHLERYYSTGSTAEKIKILNWIVKYVSKISGGKLPDSWNIINKK